MGCVVVVHRPKSCRTVDQKSYSADAKLVSTGLEGKCVQMTASEAELQWATLAWDDN